MIYIQSRQSIFPKSVYIGDKTELRASFTYEGGAIKNSLSVDSFVQTPDYSLYDINSIELEASDQGNYTLVIKFVPWHTGKLAFPDIEIEGAGFIHFDDINVLSLVEQEGVEELKTFSSPLLLPGTIYKVYTCIALFVILLILFIRLFVKREAIAFRLKNYRLKRRYSRNKKITVRQLKALSEETTLTDSQKADLIQKIMRSYLELRLAYPFTKTLTSELSGAFEKASAGLADENRFSAFEEIISVFVRTDYIRFARASDAVFNKKELPAIVNSLLDAINIIEEEGK